MILRSLHLLEVEKYDGLSGTKDVERMGTSHITLTSGTPDVERVGTAHITLTQKLTKITNNPTHQTLPNLQISYSTLP
jgi:hypothetical protein